MQLNLTSQKLNIGVDQRQFSSVHKKCFICFIFICTWPGSVFSLWFFFFKLQFTLMMRKALTAHCKKIINIQRPDKDKSFLLVHNINSSQHQIKPVGEKNCIQSKGGKIELLLLDVKTHLFGLGWMVIRLVAG